MKRLFLILFVLTVVFAVSVPAFGITSAAENAEVDSSAKSAYLMDYDTGTVIYAKRENERLPIASMTKIMTSLLVFEAVDGGKLTYDTQITVSANAASMGGSQVFLDADSVHSVENLLKTVVVASANDSSVALAEAVAGSEQAFVQLMNSRAKEIGLQNTNFTNCTGLPAVNAYSSAKDVSIMLKLLLSHGKYFELAKVWLEDYAHPDGRITTITNTNKLVRFYNGCDAGKTGYTSEALFCLAASAKRGDMRLICTVIGEQNSKKRFADVSNMFNYAFASYENKILFAKAQGIENTIEVVKGKKSTVAAGPASNISAFVRKGSESNAEVIINLPDKIKAPINTGDKIGTASVVVDGVVVNEIDIIALEDIGKASFFDSIKKICGNW